jgi:hypothetical protein
MGWCIDFYLLFKKDCIFLLKKHIFFGESGVKIASYVLPLVILGLSEFMGDRKALDRTTKLSIVYRSIEVNRKSLSLPSRKKTTLFATSIGDKP